MGIRHSCWEKKVTGVGEVGQVASGGNWAHLAHRKPLSKSGKGAPSSPWKPSGPTLIQRHNPRPPTKCRGPPAERDSLKTVFAMQKVVGPAYYHLLFFFVFKGNWKLNFCV